METLIPFALLCFTSFFTLTNPLGTMPVFLTMTQGMTDKERRSIVSRATLVRGEKRCVSKFGRSENI